MKGISKDLDASIDLAFPLILIGGGALKIFSFLFELFSLIKINRFILVEN